jgi:hypothetical protein
VIGEGEPLGAHPAGREVPRRHAGRGNLLDVVPLPTGPAQVNALGPPGGAPTERAREREPASGRPACAGAGPAPDHRPDTPTGRPS